MLIVNRFETPLRRQMTEFSYVGEVRRVGTMIFYHLKKPHRSSKAE